jgi:hypothetical protein
MKIFYITRGDGKHVRVENRRDAIEWNAQEKTMLEWREIENRTHLRDIVRTTWPTGERAPMRIENQENAIRFMQDRLGRYER